MWPVVPATTAVPEHWMCRLRQGPRHYTQWSTECNGSCKQLADVVQQFAVRDESPAWSRHLDWVAPRRVSRHHTRQDHVLSPCMVWSLLSIRPCKTGLISEPMQAPWFLWQFYTHHIRHFSNADDSLFKTILKNSYHVLYPYLPENHYQHYRLRQHPHNKALIPKTTYLSDRDYIMRMLYKNCY